MASFKSIIHSHQGELLQFFHKFTDTPPSDTDRIDWISDKAELKREQIICAIGFNSHAYELDEILPIMGLESFESLKKLRNDIFISDVYKKITLENIENIYAVAKDSPDKLQIIRYMLPDRLSRIEDKIENTVNSKLIEKYKVEMRMIYNDEIADIDFAESRLSNEDSGFRALINEVSIIIESKLIPAGDIFFRNNILPEEKRKIMSKGLIPEQLIVARLDEDEIPSEEKRILQDYLVQQQRQ